jgi:DNA mismatch repair protein MutL
VRRTLIDSTPIRGLGAWLVPSEGQSPGWGGELDEHAFIRRPELLQPEFALARPLPEPEGDGSRDGTREETAVSPSPSAAPLAGHKLPIMRVVGQVGAAYIITEGPDGLYLIDQHAAHERILYEQFLAQWQERQVVSQGLVTGTAVHLSPPQATLLEEHLDTFVALGFHLEPFGPNAFMLRALPALLAKLDPAQAVLSVVEDLERGDAPMQEAIERKIILRVCKTAAVKAGQTLSPAEMEAMVWQLEACQNPHTCPHGRPTLIYLSVAQLARQFGRI